MKSAIESTGDGNSCVTSLSAWLDEGAAVVFDQAEQEDMRRTQSLLDKEVRLEKLTRILE